MGSEERERKIYWPDSERIQAARRMYLLKGEQQRGAEGYGKMRPDD
jgi:hypothetical protein